MDLHARLAHPGVRWALQVVAVAAAYVATGKFGLELAFESSSVTAIWAPTGISLAALVLWGPRVWPGVALGALLTNLGTGVPFYTVAGITVGNTLEAVVGAWLLRELADFRPGFDRVRDVFSLVAFGALLSTIVSATIGVASLRVAGEIGSGDLLSTWRTWWLGDMGGDLIVAPAVLVAAAWRAEPRGLPGGPFEATALAAGVTGISVLVFTQETSLVYLTFPLLVWAALRFWQPGAVVAGVVLAAAAVYFTEHGQGPFAGEGPDERLLLAVTFVGGTGLITLVLATVTHAREQADRAARALAVTLQDSLLAPELPELPRLETAAYFRAAGEGQRVGGDFYDLFQTDDASWVLAVGDVCGKGANAAAMTALARYTLRAGAAREREPRRVLERLNEAILWQRPSEDYCTVAYIRMDLEGDTTRLTFASGGHPLPLILRASGSVDTLGRPGMLLGVERRPQLTEQQAVLHPGDTLLVYTDGLTDAFAPDEIVTTHLLARHVADLAGRPPAELLAELRDRLLVRETRHPRDDVAIVALRMAPATTHQVTSTANRRGRDMSENLARTLTETAAEHGDRTAVKLDDVELSYSALDGATAHMAGVLKDRGVEPGDRVGIMLPNVPYFPVVYYGILRAGGVVVPMNVLLKGREVKFYLEDPGAKLVFAWHDFAEAAEQGAKEAGAECVLVKPGEFEELVGGTEAVTELADRGGQDTAVILYTSGTTGKPKGAELTHANLSRNAKIAVSLFSLNHEAVILGALPLFHSFGQTCGMNAGIAAGGTLTLIPRFDPGKALEIIQRDKVNVFEGVPTMYNAMLHDPGRDSFDTSSLQVCASGGSAMPVELMRGFEDAFGCKILEGYGLSETSPIASFNHPDKERKPGSIGTPIEGVEMKVVDDQRNEVARGEIGEIAIKGHNIMKGYWNRPEATEESIDDGWFHTGDMAKVDEDGYFYIVDRKKELIIRGGYNVYPREIEEVLYEHPAVQEAAVVGVPDDALGEEVGAAVCLKKGEGVTEDELRSYVKNEVAAYKYPRKIWFVDELPKGPTGKILKREIEVPAEVEAAGSA